MATVYENVLPIDQVYEPHEIQTATAGRRLAAYVLDSVIGLFTLYIGWLIWFIFTAPKGQTPGKQLVRLYTMRDDGTRAGGWYTWLREIVVKGLLFSLLSLMSGGIVWLIAALWLLWDRDRQCLWDKITSTHIGYSPNRFVPETSTEQRFSGNTRTRPPGQQVTVPISTSSTVVGSESAATEVRDPLASPVGDRLRELQRLREEGLITAEEYEERRLEVVKDL